jgi:hypothetical protein
VVRGEESRQFGPVKLPRQQLSLEIVLPFGSLAGSYEIEVISKPDAPLVRAAGDAKIIDGLTVLRLRSDLRPLTPGRFLLGIRRIPWDWTYIPVDVE